MISYMLPLGRPGEGLGEHPRAEQRMGAGEHERRGLCVMAVMGESKVGRGKKSLLRHLGFPRPPLVLDRVLVH